LLKAGLLHLEGAALRADVDVLAAYGQPFVGHTDNDATGRAHDHAALGRAGLDLRTVGGVGHRHATATGVLKGAETVFERRVPSGRLGGADGVDVLVARHVAGIDRVEAVVLFGVLGFGRSHVGFQHAQAGKDIVDFRFQVVEGGDQTGFGGFKALLEAGIDVPDVVVSGNFECHRRRATEQSGGKHNNKQFTHGFLSFVEPYAQVGKWT